MFWNKKPKEPTNSELIEKMLELNLKHKHLEQQIELLESNWKSWKTTLILKYKKICEKEEEEEEEEKEPKAKDINALLGFKI